MLVQEAKLLPIFVLAALKNPVMRDGVDVRADERSYLMMMVRQSMLVCMRVDFVWT